MGRPSPYTAELKAEAMRMVREADRSIASIARDLGISETTLGNWCRQDRMDRGERRDPEQLTTGNREELRRLRRENAEVADGAGDLEKSRGLLRQGDDR